MKFWTLSIWSFILLFLYQVTIICLKTETMKRDMIKFFQKNIRKLRKTIFDNENIEPSLYCAIYRDINGRYSLRNKKESSGQLLAEGYFHKVLFSKGWDKLSIHTYKSANPYQQTYLAGYLEGRMTSNEIFNFYDNLRSNNKLANPIAYNKMYQFFEEVASHFVNKVNRLKYETKNLSYADKKYWSQLMIGFTQLDGLMRGYSYEIQKKGEKYKTLTIADFLIIQADGEIPELLRYFNSQHAREVHQSVGGKDYFYNAFGMKTQDPMKFWGQMLWTSKCSAFIKLTTSQDGSWKDILAGHTTWTAYYEMLRMYKDYKFEFEDKDELSKSEIIFSSYPGCISSTDDFYISNNKILVMETTIEIVDIAVYSGVKNPKDYIPNFLRVLAATRFAKTGEEWVKLFSQFNSGTYSSQWMVVDYNVFEKIKRTKQRANGLLYISEQIPGRIVSHDISNYLFEKKYFGSFNRAFLTETKQDIHQSLINNLYGDRFGYTGAFRGKIFRSLTDTVSDMKSLKDLLRYNGFKLKTSKIPDDPSFNNPGVGISARYDLSGNESAHLSGGIDCKLTNSELVNDLTSIAISGPTTENNSNLTPFDWEQISKLRPGQRNGVPQRFNFPYIIMSPKTLCCDNDNDVYQFANSGVK